MDAGEIRVKLTLDSSGLKTGIEQAKAGLVSWRDETNTSTRDMLKWGSAIAAYTAPVVAAGIAAYATVEKFGAMADQIRDLSYTTGLSTEKIQQLQYAAVLSGTAFPTVTTGINQFTLAVAEAGDKTSTAAQAFATLGVTTEGRTYDQIWSDTAKALVSVKDETTRAELANTLYGRSWKEMLPYLKTYVDNAGEIESIDYLSDEQLSDLENAKVSLDKLGAQVTILEGQVVSFFAKLHEEGSKTEAKNTVLDRLFAGQGLDAFIPNSDEMAGGSATTSTPASTPAASPSTSSQTNASKSFTDKYRGLTGATLQLTRANDQLTSAFKEQAAAIQSGNIDAYDAASYRIALLKDEISRLNTVLRQTAKAARVSGIGAGEYTDSEGNTTTTSNPDNAGLNNFSQMSADEINSFIGTYKGGSKNVQDKAKYWLNQKTKEASGSSSVTVRVVAEEGTLAKKVGQQGA